MSLSPLTPLPQRLADPVGPRDHALGPANAPVTLLEYGDYECPDCFNAQPVIAELRRRLGDKLRLVFRHFPRGSVHPRASAAAMAAEAAASQGKFWEMHQMLFDHQKTLADLDLTHMALRVGIEIYRFQNDYGSEIFARHVRADYDSGQRSGVIGTPTFFINEQRYTGPTTLDALMKCISSHL